METSSHPFSETGFNSVEVGASLFKTLDITPNELGNPTQFNKLKEIASFLNSHPDPLFIIQNVSVKNKSNLSNLDYLYGYTQLYKQKTETEERLGKIKKELAYYE